MIIAIVPASYGYVVVHVETAFLVLVDGVTPYRVTFIIETNFVPGCTCDRERKS